MADGLSPAAAARLQRSDRWVRTDDAARWAFRLAMVVAAVVLVGAGRHQWFIRDDWAFVVTRNRIRNDSGVLDWLFTPQDGHLMVVPVLVYRLVENVFGLGSYWPFLLTTMIPHVAIVLVVRVLCRRQGVSEWTTTLVCAVLLVFGSGWENILFGIQITYNLSLLGFLVQVLLTDHDGPLDRRDLLGLVAGLVGVMSSGFGPFFIAGIALFLLLRMRWRAAAFAAIPLALFWGVWWLAYGSDEAADRVPGGKSQVPAFAVRGLTATFEGLVSFRTLGGVALVATLAVTVWRRSGRTNALLLANAAVAAMMLVGIGVQRVGLGIESAAASRYVYMGAMLLAPAFALAVDRLRLVAPAALLTGRLIVTASILINIGSLLSSGTAWANRSSCERRVFSLLAGSPEQIGAIDPIYQPVPFSPDVRLRDLADLVGQDAFPARPPSGEEETALVAQALTAGNTVCLTAADLVPAGQSGSAAAAAG